MNKFKFNISEVHLRRPVRKKIGSVLLAAVMFVTGLPHIVFEDVFEPEITAYAKNENNLTIDQKPSSDKAFSLIGSPTELEEYSKYYYFYPENHFDKDIIIQFGETDDGKTMSEFVAIGTEDYPFEGKITILSETGSSEIKIPEAFFNYVSDKAEIEGDLLLQRSTNDTSEAVFARHIKHDSSVTEPNTWSVQLNNYVDKDKNTFNDYGHAGFIDEMEKDAMASIQITDNTGSNVGVNNDTAQSVGAVGDLGYACGKMGRNTRLTVSFSGTNTAYSVKTTSGHAGGIVGYNDGGIVKLDDSISSYSIGGTISGTTGVGGMFGYYRPIFDDPTTTGTETNAGDINLSKYAVTATVNGTGNIGGLFGTLVNKDVSITEAVGETPETRTDSAGGTIRITNGSVSLTHNDGNAANIGGIAGRYEAYSLSETLEITSDSANELSGVTVTSISMDQSYDTYGGAIGCVGTSAYVKFKDFTLSNATGCGSADKYFGGLIGSGDQAFIDAEGITISASNFRGGGAVGSLGNGVLKLSGTVNLSGATPNETVSNSGNTAQVLCGIALKI